MSPYSLREKSHRCPVAIIAMDSVDLLEGGLPRRQQRMVEAWAELHRESSLKIGSACKPGDLLFASSLSIEAEP